MGILEQLFLEPVNTSAVENPLSPVHWRLELLPVTPNPTGGAARVAFVLPAAGPVTVDVFDASGRRVRRLLEGPLAAGPHRIDWDGRTGAGRPAAAGRYWIALEAGAASRTRAVTLVR
jgi:hypothetical protein